MRQTLSQPLRKKGVIYSSVFSWERKPGVPRNSTHCSHVVEFTESAFKKWYNCVEKNSILQSDFSPTKQVLLLSYIRFFSNVPELLANF